MDVDLDDLQESVINPLVDFSVDFVGNFDPNCLLKVDVEKMLQTAVDVQDHQAMQSFYEKKKNENEKLRSESSSRFPSIDVNSMLDSRPYRDNVGKKKGSVSYTHLTLPTILLV